MALGFLYGAGGGDAGTDFDLKQFIILSKFSHPYHPTDGYSNAGKSYLDGNINTEVLLSGTGKYYAWAFPAYSLCGEKTLTISCTFEEGVSGLRSHVRVYLDNNILIKDITSDTTDEVIDISGASLIRIEIYSESTSNAGWNWAKVHVTKMVLSGHKDVADRQLDIILDGRLQIGTMSGNGISQANDHVLVTRTDSASVNGGYIQNLTDLSNYRYVEVFGTSAGTYAYLAIQVGNVAQSVPCYANNEMGYRLMDISGQSSLSSILLYIQNQTSTGKAYLLRALSKITS